MTGKQVGDKIRVSDVEFPQKDKIELTVEDDSMILKVVDKKQVS